jgi:hypothetical protein
MKILMIAIAVLVAVTITTSSAQAFCGDSCVEGQHVLRDSYGNEIRLIEGTWYPVAHMVGRNYQPAYHEMGEGES